MTRDLRPPLRFAAIALVLSMASGCTGDPPDDVAPASTPESSPAAVFASDTEALAAAEEAYGAYLRVSNDIGSGGWIETAKYADVSIGPALKDVQMQAVRLHGKGYRQTGSSTFDQMAVQAVEPGPDGTAKVRAYVCLDVTQTDIIAGSGESVVSADRAAILPLLVTLSTGAGGSMPLMLEGSETWESTTYCS